MGEGGGGMGGDRNDSQTQASLRNRPGKGQSGRIQVHNRFDPLEEDDGWALPPLPSSIVEGFIQRGFFGYQYHLQLFERDKYFL